MNLQCLHKRIDLLMAVYVSHLTYVRLTMTSHYWAELVCSTIARHKFQHRQALPIAVLYCLFQCHQTLQGRLGLLKRRK